MMQFHIKRNCTPIGAKRTCVSCSVPKGPGDFRLSNGSLRKECRKCENLKIRKRKRKRNAEWKVMAVKLLGGKCSICGYRRCIKALDFHHHNKDKDQEIAEMMRRNNPWASIEREIRKCVLLCANCHREAHYQGELAESDLRQASC